MEGRGHAKRLGFGVTSRPPAGLGALTGVGARLEALGYDEAWANDGQQRNGLPNLEALAAGTERLLFGLGVAPLSERTADDVASDALARRLPAERLIVGVGTGRSASLALVREGVARLRECLPRSSVAVAALGPRICRLAGEVADVVLLNWALPHWIERSRELVAEGARAAGRTEPRVAMYVRVAIGQGAEERLTAEAGRYLRQPKYRAHFEAQGAGDTVVPGIAAGDPAQLPTLLAPYRAVLDSCIVRALPRGEEGAELLDIAEAAAL